MLSKNRTKGAGTERQQRVDRRKIQRHAKAMELPDPEVEWHNNQVFVSNFDYAIELVKELSKSTDLGEAKQKYQKIVKLLENPSGIYSAS